MKLNRRQLRRIILNEINSLNEVGFRDLGNFGIKGIDKRPLMILDKAVLAAEETDGPNASGNISDEGYEDLKAKFKEVVAAAKQSGNSDITKKGSETHQIFYALARRIAWLKWMDLGDSGVKTEAEEMLK